MAEPICYCGASTQEECDAKVAEELAFLSGGDGADSESCPTKESSATREDCEAADEKEETER